MGSLEKFLKEVMRSDQFLISSFGGCVRVSPEELSCVWEPLAGILVRDAGGLDTAVPFCNEEEGTHMGSTYIIKN